MIRIRLLGGVDVTVADRSAELPRGHRVVALLGWLALHPGPQPRTRLAMLFWPDTPEPGARASLRSAVWALRAALGPHAGEILMGDRESVGLDAAGLWVDALAVRDLMRAGRLDEASALCRGELLGELDDDWVVAAREEHAEVMLRLFSALAADAEGRGDRDAAVAWTRRLVAERPLDEAAARQLMRRRAATGDTAGAWADYTGLRSRLRAELGVEPAVETRRAAARVCACHGRGVVASADRLPLPPRAKPRAGQESWWRSAQGGVPLSGRDEDIIEHLRRPQERPADVVGRALRLLERQTRDGSERGSGG